MVNFDNVKATIDANIRQNGNEEITGPVLNSVLNQMTDASADVSSAEIATEDATVTKTTLDPTSYTLRNYSLNENGNYGTSTNYKHILIPCSPGDVFYIKGSLPEKNAPTRLAWFTSNATPVAGGAAPLVTGTTRMNLEGGASGAFLAPSGTNYLFVFRGLITSDYPNTPQEITQYKDIYSDDIDFVTVAPPCYYNEDTRTLHIYYIYYYLRHALSSTSIRVDNDISGSGTGAFVIPASKDSVVFRSTLVEGDTTLLRINSTGKAIGGMLLPYINAARIDDLDAVMQNKYKGMKMVSTGGSIVYGTGLTNRATENYTYLVAQKLGMTYANYGIPGSTIGKKPGTYDGVYFSLDAWNAAVSGGQVDTTKKYLVKNNASTAYPYRLYTYSGGSWSYSGAGTDVNARTPLVDRMAEMDMDADVVLIMGGGNDWMYVWDDLGTDSDDTNETIIGAMHKICKYVMETYPQKLVIWIGLPPSWRYQPAGVSGATWSAVTWDAVNPAGDTYADVENAVKMVLKQYGIHFYPIADDLMFSQVDRWWCADTNGAYLHPNATGHQLMADALVKCILSIR